ncbi:hypothetical protein M440DRAFT_1211113 [Trichoderma longibrachiatum ATCC 18648]|uniref:Protein kinase domain-containing protein n=1 Tax=Trichoderma longibrachiatum ATCC 18648 TaxID=983965 RepID=A0A2T4C746_TRILO|nr:hypothetical protein M440DRAFT_1211113 [Trichoderma longibrachiatum ATCC 18648]
MREKQIRHADLQFNCYKSLDHPHIVQCDQYNLSRINLHELHIYMEYCDYGNLERLIQHGREQSSSRRTCVEGAGSSCICFGSMPSRACRIPHRRRSFGIYRLSGWMDHYSSSTYQSKNNPKCSPEPGIGS